MAEETALQKQKAKNLVADQEYYTPTQTVTQTGTDAEGNTTKKEYTIGGTLYKVDQETTNQLVLDLSLIHI